MQAGVGYSDLPDSVAAGRQAAEKAVLMSGRQDPCDLALLFGTFRHDQDILREAVASVIGADVPVYGGGAIGVITNDDYGYAGDQVGIACLWLDGSSFSVLAEAGLAESEADTGFRLAQGLGELGMTSDSTAILLYDAIYRDDASMRLLMATPLLEGVKKYFGEMPVMTGAGLMADFECSPSRQYTGSGTGQHMAMALLFDDDIRIDNVIMHGCRPASPYYTVTKAEGPVILEINNRPALAFMDEILGSALLPEQYPFILLFGVNHGERWSDYDENNYASRLCLGIDPERGGIIMFEPDMVAGTEFQVMYRSLELDYMRPKIDSLFDQLGDREPVFAMYFNCAGRCAGYWGADVEDAIVLQETIANRVPLLGLYTGVEIGPVAGSTRGLDWSGVLVLFSKSREDAARSSVQEPKAGTGRPSPDPGGVSKGGAEQPRAESRTQLEALTKLCEQNAAKILGLDFQTVTVRYEREIKQRGFQLIAELAVALRQTKNYGEVFTLTVQRINAALHMQKTVVFLFDDSGAFRPVIMQGFSADEQARLLNQPTEIPPQLLATEPTFVTGAHPPELFAEFREKLGLPFFISSAVSVHGEVIALLLTGRTIEQPPFLTRLGNSDMETVYAITELLGSAMLRMRLDDATRKAEIDGLTGLWNRNTFKDMIEKWLDGVEERAGAFVMIDLDDFKSINDTHGHLVGDRVLIECANAVRSVLRDSDIVARKGGDEFAVFFHSVTDRDQVERAVNRITDALNAVVVEGVDALTASIGVAMAPQHGTTFTELYGSADTALYQAKRKGRKRFEFADDLVL